MTNTITIDLNEGKCKMCGRLMDISIQRSQRGTTTGIYYLCDNEQHNEAEEID